EEKKEAFPPPGPSPTTRHRSRSSIQRMRLRPMRTDRSTCCLLPPSAPTLSSTLMASVPGPASFSITMHQGRSPAEIHATITSPDVPTRPPLVVHHRPHWVTVQTRGHC